MECKICGNTTNLEEYKVKEMMFGFRDEFLYFQCQQCQCLQIADIPDNMNKYYPSNYYSYTTTFPYAKSKLNEIIKKKRDSYVIFKKGFIGKLLLNYLPSTNLHLNSLSEISITKNTSILDVGCGSGKFLLLLQKLGFNQLQGIDPYLEKDIQYKNGLNIYKKAIHEVKDKHDVIMFHHSFEHMPEPLETLQSVSNLLHKKGYCIIRIPTVSSYAWQHYKENWVQLDAPRHLFLHSQESIQYLAEKTGLKVEKVIYDATVFQFLGSERYLKNIPLTDPTANTTIFSPNQIQSFQKKTKELNQKELGDACVFILRKK
jgi:2-polyprenyl-3-methyl-5-hydroxy-6-metoxy-1,4-benzoquinol methylase